MSVDALQESGNSLPKGRRSKFRLGALVRRRVDVYSDDSPWLHGVVTRVYQEQGSFGYYPELYEVTWDGGRVIDGYLPHGLDSDE
jgi:hypothetical protein